ncbi:MAG: Rieske 2Fe-2S domain-containing protein [Caldilineaceae bacterium]|nr:Rieske 2Fe-2S domain-containing protein [Caldilineaceae bacterium]MDE0337215.1 Rieske 2Fe-2S domain-containing protein [Caldilineaceae bacterium]
MAEVNQAWLDRVNRARQSAAERLGVDVSEMQPPRDGSTGEAAEPAPSTEAAAPQPEPAAAAAEAAPEPAPQPEPAAVAEAAPVAAAEVAPAEETPTEEAVAAIEAQTPTAVQSNGSAAAAAADRVAPVGRAAVLEGFEAGQEGINRREFLSYAWGGALTLLTLESGLATYQFMYPRFREGEFGGKFILGDSTALPQIGIDPEGNSTGKFWLINTDEGPRALYMVCTHLGCLYKWEPSNNRFECPCHGSKFNREGHYIEGPAPRSLDQFLVEIVEGGSIVATTEDEGDFISAPALPSPDAEVVVDTGKRLQGKPKALSPAKAVPS